jgi:uncharacterized protein (DUF1778 family)
MSKEKVRGSVPRPDRYSKKKKGPFRQSLRLNKENNDLIRQAAELEGMSLNLWLSRCALTAAKKVIAAHAGTT